MTLLPPQIAGAGRFLEAYDALICDVWGVLHNGIHATEGVAQCLIDARAAGKAVVLLTNAPRPPDQVAAQLAGFGIQPAAYDAILSSGGIARAMLAEAGDATFYHLGPERDAPIFAGLGVKPGPLAQATRILCTGLFDDARETPGEYRDLLLTARARGLPMICANPDLLVERGHQLLPCAGALAELYEGLGGVVHWVGKPHPLVYVEALKALDAIKGRPVAKARVLCIGDAFRTDLAGAAASGLDVLMVLAGIHRAEIGLERDHFDAARLSALIAHYGVRPTAITPTLRW